MTDEIKVGDVVEHREFKNSEWSEAIWEVLEICGNHAWVRYKDNAPRSTYVTSLRKPAPKPVVVQSTWYGHVIIGWDQAAYIPFPIGTLRYPNDTHKITFNIVDGVPDCNSIKMEKL